jgi:hypothetical protein
MSASCTGLPNFRNTEEAVRFGQFISRDQFIFLAGARAALQREFYEINSSSQLRAPSSQLLVVLATKMQLIRECLEAAPHGLLVSLLDTGILLKATDPEVELREVDFKL